MANSSRAATSSSSSARAPRFSSVAPPSASSEDDQLSEAPGRYSPFSTTRSECITTLPSRFTRKVVMPRTSYSRSPEKVRSAPSTSARSRASSSGSYSGKFSSMNVTIAASALNAPSHSARHRTKSTPGSGQNARSASYVKLCRLRFTRGFHSRMSSSYARFPRASCTCDVYTTSSSTSDGSTSNIARLSFSRSAFVVRSCALKPVCSDSASHVALGSSASAEATRARRGRGTGRDSAPVPKPPRARRGRGAPGAIARGAAASRGIAGGILSASGLLKAPRATPGSALRSQTQPTTFPAPRKPPAHYARAERCVVANARVSPRSTPVRPMRGSY